MSKQLPPISSTQDDYTLAGHEFWSVSSYRNGQVEIVDKVTGKVCVYDVECFEEIITEERIEQ